MQKTFGQMIAIALLVAGLQLGLAYAQTPPVITTDFNQFVLSIQQQFARDNQRSLERREPINIRQKVFVQFCVVMDRIGNAELPAYQAPGRSSLFYYPKQSAFIHIVCGPFGFASQLGEFSDSDYFLKDTRQSLGIYGVQGGDTSCDPNLRMVGCPVHLHFNKVIQDVLNDMFDIKQADVYGAIVPDPEPQEKDRVNAFIQKHFLGLQLCPDGNCVYPQTKNRLLAYFKRGESLLKSISIFNWAHIKTTIPATQGTCGTPYGDNYHIILCGLHSQDSNNLTQFVAMIQNELFFYRLFMAHYMGWIQAESALQPDEYRAAQLFESRVTTVINTTQQQIAWTQEASDLSFKMLREMYATFPIHIGLLIYYEDLYRLRKELTKVVTPLYALYDKLRNVQDASE